MRFKHHETMAAWAVALILVVLIAVAPWDRLDSRVPHGVVDPGNQRFAVDTLDSSERGAADVLHLEDSRFTAFGPVGL